MPRLQRIQLCVCITLILTFAGARSAHAQLTDRDLREIDSIAVDLTHDAEELHDEYHHHLEHVKHGEKLEHDVSRLEKIAHTLHDYAHDAGASDQTMKRLRGDTNELLQLSWQIDRTVDLAERWVRTSDGRRGIRHMRQVAGHVVDAVLAIDRYLPVDETVIDDQVARLEDSVKILHDEFHEHLERYEVSPHLDDDLEELEEFVEHIHHLAHNKSWRDIDLGHVLEDADEVRDKVQHIEELFVRQSRIGVRTSDYIGIEHSRDAISDVLASANLLTHMIFKADPNLRPHHHSRFDDHDHRRPLRDRHDDDHDHYRFRYRDSDYGDHRHLHRD